jgi:hypothetical protein
MQPHKQEKHRPADPDYVQAWRAVARAAVQSAGHGLWHGRKNQNAFFTTLLVGCLTAKSHKEEGLSYVIVVDNGLRAMAHTIIGQAFASAAGGRQDHMAGGQAAKHAANGDRQAGQILSINIVACRAGQVQSQLIPACHPQYSA